jgi:hypothetical protein
MDPSERNVLVFKTRADALAPVGADTDEVNATAWNAWLKAHLAIERRGLLDALAHDICEIMDAVREEREAGEARLRREITELRRQLAEREERGAAIAEIRREYAGVERERTDSALAQRDARISALEDKLQMLLRFLSLQGLDLPRGT